MPKCPGCNKFAAFDDPEIEDSSVDLNGDLLAISVTLVVNSQCCSEQLKNGVVEGEISIDHDCPNSDLAGREIYCPSCEETQLLESGFSDSGMSYDFEAYGDSTGRKSTVGAEGYVTVKCLLCGEEIEQTIDAGLLEMTTADMESLVD